MRSFVDRLRVRLRALVHRASADRELDDELRYHIDREVERLVAAGLSPNDARTATQRAFGHTSSVKDQMRDSWGLRWIEHLGQDIHFALRGFRRAPGFVATVVLTIAIGLGLNTTAFTIFNTYVLRPLAVRDPSSLFEVFWKDPRGSGHRTAWSEYQQLAKLNVVAESFAYGVAITRSDRRPLLAQLVTGNAFQVLGGRVALGRTLLPRDAEPPAGEPVIVLSYDAWRGKFGSDSAIVGRAILVHGLQLTVVGVAAQGYSGNGTVPPDFWAPVTLLSRLQNAPDLFGEKSPALLHTVVRLKPGVSRERATAAFLTWGAIVTQDRPDSLRWTRVDLESAGRAVPLTPETIALFAPAMVAFALVMLIACANVTNVMLARGVARQREIGVRLALGAGRSRLIRQLLTESMALALPAAVLGFLVSRWTLGGAVQLMFATLPADIAGMLRLLPLAPDVRVFAFLLLAALASAALFGLAPAIQATRPNLVQASRGDFDNEFRPGRARTGLVVAQIAMCSLLLIVTGVLLRGADVATKVDPGIRTSDVVQMTLDERARAQTLERLRHEPGVVAIGASSQALLDGIYPSVGLYASERRAVVTSFVSFVDSGFFSTMGVNFVRGRTFTADEERDTSAVVIVNRAAAQAMWPGKDPLGQTIELAAEPLPGLRLSRERFARVVGVSANAVSGWIGLGRDHPAIYYPASAESPLMKILVRTDTPAGGARETLDQSLWVRDPGAVYEIHALSDYLAGQTWPFRAFAWVASSIGVIALILTVIGIYGVLSYVVAQRTREIGIRMAIGAGRDAVIALVVRQVATQAIVGLAIGVVLALALSRIFGAVLVLVDTSDVRGYALGMVVSLLGAAMAAWGPARRAVLVDPVQALRTE